jgi:hypothetical protein
LLQRTRQLCYKVLVVCSHGGRRQSCLHAAGWFTSHTGKLSFFLVSDLKVKCTLVQALSLCTGLTAHKGSRGINLLFLDHGTRRGEGSGSGPGRPLPRKDPVPTVQEAGWAPGPVWTDAENLAPTGIFFWSTTFIDPSVNKYNGYMRRNSIMWCVRNIILVCLIFGNCCVVSQWPLVTER